MAYEEKPREILVSELGIKNWIDFQVDSEYIQYLFDRGNRENLGSVLETAADFVEAARKEVALDYFTNPRLITKTKVVPGKGIYLSSLGSLNNVRAPKSTGEEEITNNDGQELLFAPLIHMHAHTDGSVHYCPSIVDFDYYASTENLDYSFGNKIFSRSNTSPPIHVLVYGRGSSCGIKEMEV